MTTATKTKFTDLKLPEFKKYELPEGNWKPTFARIKLEVIQDSLSSIIDTSGTVHDPYVMCRVLDWGSLVGYDRVIENGQIISMKVEHFNVGDVVLTTRSNLTYFKDPRGDTHVFLHSEDKIIARFEPKEQE